MKSLSHQDIRVTIQQIGGWGKKGVNLKPITIDAPGRFVRLLHLEIYPALTDPALPDGWVNFYRVDDYAAVSYFYLDKPSSNLPALAPVSSRINNLERSRL